MNSFFGVRPLTNQPNQEQWLVFPLEDQAYWLLKIIDHYRDTQSMAARPRENEGYQTGTMLIKPDGFNHHENQVISVVDQATRWLLNKGFMRQFPGQTDGVFQITQKGFDLADIVKRDDEPLQSLIEFVENKNQLEPYEVEPADVLSLFINRMEKSGKIHTQVTINVGNFHAINLSRANSVNIQLPSLLAAARVCKSRDWLKTRYQNSNEFENLYITQEGISKYDSIKGQEKPAESQAVTDQINSVLPVNVAASENSSVVESSDSVDRNHYVVIIHGIRTQAEYQTRLAKELEQNPNIKAITLGYEFFDVIRFLTIGRNGPINKITTDIRDVKTMHPSPEKISIIAHSFGTYIVSKILERHTDIDFYRIIFCGSIVPSTFRWDKYKSKFETPILNDCGMFDIWPVFAKFATWGYGPSGRFGFKSNRVHDRFHRFKHSDFFTDIFYNDYWKPFLENGDLVEGELDREKTPLWTSVLTLVKAPILLLALGLLVVRLMGGEGVENKSNTDLILEPTTSIGKDESAVAESGIPVEDSMSIGHCVISIGGEKYEDGPQGKAVCDDLRLGISQVIDVSFSDWSRRFDSDLHKCVFRFEWFAYNNDDCSELASKIASDDYVIDNSWVVGSQLLEDVQVTGSDVSEEVAVRLDNKYELLEPNFIDWEHDYVEIQRFVGDHNKSDNANKIQNVLELQGSLPGSSIKALVVTNAFYWDVSTRKDVVCEYAEELLASRPRPGVLVDCRAVFIDTHAQSGIFSILQEIIVQVDR